jgi:hypothetical protein
VWVGTSCSADGAIGKRACLSESGDILVGEVLDLKSPRGVVKSVLLPHRTIFFPKQCSLTIITEHSRARRRGLCSRQRFKQRSLQLLKISCRCLVLLGAKSLDRVRLESNEG